MKIRLIKKHAKARHTYGFSRIGLKLDMQEIASYAFLRKKGNMRLFTHYTHRNQKLFRKHTGLPKNRYYSFFLITPVKKIKRHFSY